MDRNGYNKSIMSTTPGECYICGRTTETVRHEIFYGTANRGLSKKWGLWLDICPVCHKNVHGKPMDYLYIKIAAQRQFEAMHGHDQFMALFGRNYL